MNTYSMNLLFTALVAGASISKSAGNKVADYGDKYAPQQPYEPIQIQEPYVPDVVEPYQPEPSYGGDSYGSDNKGDCGRGHLHKHRSGKTHCHHHRHHHGRKY